MIIISSVQVCVSPAKYIVNSGEFHNLSR